MSSTCTVIGYGSLMNPKTIDQSSAEVVAPVRIHGWERGWRVRLPEVGMTAMGVVPNPKASFNGVMIRFSLGDLPALDERESGYIRATLKKDQVEFLGGNQGFEDPCFLYWTDAPGEPCSFCPVTHSYLDLIVHGTIAQSDSFTEEFFRTTTHWQHLVDDRLSPVYHRALPIESDAIVDRALGQWLPEILKTRILRKPQVTD